MCTKWGEEPLVSDTLVFLIETMNSLLSYGERSKAKVQGMKWSNVGVEVT